MSIKIKNKIIGNDAPVFIIAEIGVNHNGQIELAKDLILAAAKAGADAVKLQTYDTDLLIRRDAPKAKYQDVNVGLEKSQYQMLKELELDPSAYQVLKELAEENNIILFSTPYDEKSLELLKSIDVQIYKLASIDIVHHTLIEKIAQTKKPLILSTGMSTEEEIKQASSVFYHAGGTKENLILLQCNTNYPAKIGEQNLRASSVLNKFAGLIGYSDHTEGNQCSIAAIAMGAKVIERHLTLNKNLPGPDHKASLDPIEFKNFVDQIRNLETALGSGIKSPAGQELENITGMRRSICAAKDIPEGKEITMDDLGFKRPGTGLYPTKENLNKVIGKHTKKNIPLDENINLEDLF